MLEDEGEGTAETYSWAWWKESLFNFGGVGIDVTLVIGLIPSVTIGMLAQPRGVSGGVLGFIGIAFMLLSVVDAGSVESVGMLLKKPAGGEWQVENVQEDMAGKARRDEEEEA